MSEIRPVLPHRIIGNIVGNILEVPKSVSEAISSALDRGPLGDRGPHRFVDSAVKAIPSTLQTLNEKITITFDRPIQATGALRERT